MKTLIVLLMLSVFMYSGFAECIPCSSGSGDSTSDGTASPDLKLSANVELANDTFDTNPDNGNPSYGDDVYYEGENFMLYLFYGIAIFIGIIVIGLIILKFYKPPKEKGIVQDYKDLLEKEQEERYKEPPEETKEEKEYEVSKEEFRKMWE